MINKENHLMRPWKVHAIANDFILWDVWEIPISANNSSTENFQAFYGMAFKTFGKLQTKTSLVSILFTLRSWIGRILPLDRNINTLPIPGCLEISVKSRLNSRDIEKSKVVKPLKVNNTDLEFRPVYLFEDESLHELSNDTVHALIHLGWIRKDENHYTATLAVYVIPRGIYGKAYLKLIEPFRRFVIYPGMINSIKEQWEEYLISKVNRCDCSLPSR